MEKEITALENAPCVGVFKALWKGFCSLFKNIVPFCKLTILPALFMGLALFMMMYPIVVINGGFGFMLFRTFSIFFLGIVLFIYSFWVFLLGLVASTYLAKDALENKPLQPVKKYFEYVSNHEIPYIKFWLWNILIQIGYAVLVMVLVTALILINPLLLVFFAVIIVASIPFYIAIYFSPLFFAYEDKTKPLNCILHAIKTAYIKPFEVFGLAIILALITHITGWLVSDILSQIFPLRGSIKYMITLPEFAPFCLWACALGGFLCVVFGFLSTYVLTKCYFELVKNN